MSMHVHITAPMYTHEHLYTPILALDFDKCGRPAYVRPFAIPIGVFFLLFRSYHFRFGVAFILIWRCHNFVYLGFLSQFVVKSRPRRFRNANII